MDTFHATTETRILDVGGDAFNWDLIKRKSKITILNLSKPKEMLSSHENYDFVVGDSTALLYEDNSFDIAYSNSVIEHLHTYERHKLFASELNRVSKKLWVQTPARSFFIEPHLITPFVHYFQKIGNVIY